MHRNYNSVRLTSSAMATGWCETHAGILQVHTGDSWGAAKTSKVRVTYKLANSYRGVTCRSQRSLDSFPSFTRVSSQNKTPDWGLQSVSVRFPSCSCLEALLFTLKGMKVISCNTVKRKKVGETRFCFYSAYWIKRCLSLYPALLWIIRTTLFVFSLSERLSVPLFFPAVFVAVVVMWRSDAQGGKWVRSASLEHRSSTTTKGAAAKTLYATTWRTE